MPLNPEVPALLTLNVPPEVKVWTLKVCPPEEYVVTVPPVATMYRDLPYRSLMEMAPEGFCANARTSASFRLIWAVDDFCSSTLTCDSERGPDDGSAIT
jgi:hypothetical protein